MRDNIYHEIADKESGDFLFFPLFLSLSLFFVLYFSFTLSRSPLLSIFLSLFFSFSLFFFSLFHVWCFASCTHTQVRVHVASDRSRASFEKQCERHAGLSFLPTFLLAHVVVPGSCSQPVPLFGAFPVRLPRGLSFAPSLSTRYTLVHRVVRSLFQRFSLTISAAGIPPSPSLSSVSVAPRTRYDHLPPMLSDLTSPSPLHSPPPPPRLSSLGHTNPSTFPLRLSEMFSISLPIRPCLPIDATPIAPV